MNIDELRPIVFELLDEYFKTKNKKFNFKQSLINYGFSEQLVNEWIIVRKNKKASNTETAYKCFISEIEKRTCNLNEVLTIIVQKSWSGFKWEWIDNINRSQNGITEKQQGVNDLANAANEILSNIGGFDYTTGG